MGRRPGWQSLPAAQLKAAALMWRADPNATIGKVAEAVGISRRCSRRIAVDVVGVELVAGWPHHRRRVGGSPKVAMGDRAEAVRMWEAGASLRDVGSRFGVSRDTVARWCRSAGVEVCHRTRGGLPVEEARARALKMIDAGARQVDVARELRVDPRSIWIWRRSRV